MKVIVEFRRCLKLECMSPDIKDGGIPQVEPLEDQELLAYTTKKEVE